MIKDDDIASGIRVPFPSGAKVSKLKLLYTRTKKNTSDVKHGAENHSTRNLKDDIMKDI